MSDDFRFGDPRGTDASDDMGGCCGKPTGCRIESRGCVRKLEKAEWQALADHPDTEAPAMTIWLCAEYGMRSADAQCFDTVAEAIAAADVLRRAGKVAYVWPVEVE